MNENSWPKVPGNRLMVWCCVVQPADLSSCCLPKFPVYTLVSLKVHVTVVSSMLPISQHMYLWFGTNCWSYVHASHSLDPSVRSVTSFLLQITELGLLPLLRIIRFRFAQFSGWYLLHPWWQFVHLLTYLLTPWSSPSWEPNWFCS